MFRWRLQNIFSNMVMFGVQFEEQNVIYFLTIYFKCKSNDLDKVARTISSLAPKMTVLFFFDNSEVQVAEKQTQAK